MSRDQGALFVRTSNVRRLAVSVRAWAAPGKAVPPLVVDGQEVRPKIPRESCRRFLRSSAHRSRRSQLRTPPG
jgi:hypothetical protein